MRTLTPVLAMILCLAASVSLGQTILRVRASAPAGGNGQSWATAYNTLGAALTAAVAGDEIWVAAGTYTGVAGRAAFQMKTGVDVFGGFAGSESLRDQRDPTSRVTTLSGATQRTVVAFLTVTDVVLDGLRLSEGWGGGDIDSDPEESCPGGGMYIYQSQAVIKNCDIDTNKGVFLRVGFSGPMSDTGDGGGAFIRQSEVVFDGCRIANNAVQNTVGGCEAGHPIVRVFAGRGAGITSVSSSVDLIDCIFQSNRAANGANGIGCGSTGYVSAGTYGGNGGGVFGIATTLRVDRCIFAGNSAGGGGSGGSLWGTCYSPPGVSGNGGAICNQGITTITNSSFIANTTRTNSFICSNNAGGSGSAVYATGALAISNSLFYGNVSPGSQNGLGSIFGNQAIMSNCIVWANTNDDGTTQSAQLGGDLPENIRYCVVQNLSTNNNGNLSLNPLFLDPDGPNNILGDADDRFDLAFASPAIDAGDNSAALGFTLDLANNPRFHDVLQVPDTGVGTAPIIDIGPYEFSRCPVDLDDDQGSGTPDNAVTIADLLYFLSAFENGLQPADLDNGTSTGVLDNAVTIDDLLFFLVHFEAGC